MRFRTVSLALLFLAGIGAGRVFASDKSEFDAKVVPVIRGLNREAKSGVENLILIGALTRREYGTREAELKWAADRSIGWGDIVALAYIQATTGQSFEELTSQRVQQDYWAYAEKIGMSADKMSGSLQGFWREAEKERNTRIFVRLRSTGRISSMPDLGSGFGLFQESLDFRYIGVSRPIKIQLVGGAGVEAKGGK